MSARLIEHASYKAEMVPYLAMVRGLESEEIVKDLPENTNITQITEIDADSRI